MSGWVVREHQYVKTNDRPKQSPEQRSVKHLYEDQWVKEFIYGYRSN